MLLFSQRQKLAKAVERRMKKDEKTMEGCTLTRCHFNTINYLMRMGWLRDKPLRGPSIKKLVRDIEALGGF